MRTSPLCLSYRYVTAALLWSQRSHLCSWGTSASWVTGALPHLWEKWFKQKLCFSSIFDQDCNLFDAFEVEHNRHMWHHVWKRVGRKTHGCVLTHTIITWTLLEQICTAYISFMKIRLLTSLNLATSLYLAQAPRICYCLKFLWLYYKSQLLIFF